MHTPMSRRMVLAGGLAAWAGGSLAASRSYELFEGGSKVTFLFTSSGVTQAGSLPVSTADILVDTQNLARSSATVSADIRRVRADLPFVSEAIKSPDLLHASKHPIVRFASTKIVLGTKGRISEGARMEGQLTLRGVTRPISLDATLSRPAGTAPDDLSVLFVQLNGTLSRRAFGASGFAGLAEDTVALDIRTEIRARI